MKITTLFFENLLLSVNVPQNLQICWYLLESYESLAEL